MISLPTIADTLEETLNFPTNSHRAGLRDLIATLRAFDLRLRSLPAQEEPQALRVEEHARAAAEQTLSAFPELVEAFSALPDVSAREKIFTVGYDLRTNEASTPAQKAGGHTLIFLGLLLITANGLKDMTDEEDKFRRALRDSEALKVIAEATYNLHVRMGPDRIHLLARRVEPYGERPTFPYQSVALATLRVMSRMTMRDEDRFHYFMAAYTLLCYGAAHPSSADAIDLEEWAELAEEVSTLSPEDVAEMGASRRTSGMCPTTISTSSPRTRATRRGRSKRLLKKGASCSVTRMTSALWSATRSCCWLRSTSSSLERQRTGRTLRPKRCGRRRSRRSRAQASANI